MKPNLNFRGLLLFLAAILIVCSLSVMAYIDPVCDVTCGSWTCTAGGITNAGTLSVTNVTVCIGGSVTSTLSGVGYTNGVKTRPCSDTCGHVWTDTQPVNYTINNWWEPVIPTTFTNSGTFYFTNKVQGVSQDGDCPSTTAIVISGVLTVTVSNSPPVILNQPANQAVLLGSNATFTVTATGCPYLNYQWWFNSTNLIGSATNASLMITNVQTTNAGIYSVTVTDPSGAVTSSNAVLTVSAAPIIIMQPTNQAVIQGSLVSFAVSATGATPLSYQWWFNQTNIIFNAKTPLLKLNDVQPAQAGTYSVTITNAFGAVTSSNAVLTVNCPPFITLQPVDQSVLVGTNVTFIAGATGTLPLHYQWVFNDTNVLSNQTNASLSLANVQSGQTGRYSVIVTNLYGTATSYGALLIVGNPPTISTQPVSQTIVQGSNATFSVTASGFSPLQYQWRHNNVDIPGATAGSYTVVAGQSQDAGNYCVAITNALGSVTSSNALLTVNIPPTIFQQPQSQTAMSGSTVTFSVGATGTLPRSYQWFFNGTNIAGATNTSLILNNVQSANVGNYSVTVTNVAGTVTSSNAALTVLVPPQIVTPPQSITAVQNSNVTFSVTAIGTAPLNYQWRLNGVNIAGATSSTYARYSVQPADAGTCSVVITNLAGCVTSSASLAVIVPPSVISPASQTAVWGTDVTFTASASGSPTLNYQWYANGIALTDGSKYSGAMTGSLSISNVIASDSVAYTVVVSNGAGSVSSVGANLTVVGISNVIVFGSYPIIQGSVSILAGTSITNQAIPVPTVATYPSGYPVWKILTQPAGSALSDPPAGSATATITPTVAGQYVIWAICGSSSNNFVLTAADTNDLNYDGIPDNQELGYGTNSPQVLLGEWLFDMPDWRGLEGQLPLLYSNLLLVSGWSIGAVEVNCANGNGPAWLVYPEINTNTGIADIICNRGTLRFWFKPDWFSGGSVTNGPGNEGRMIVFGNKGTTNGCWGLYVNPGGTNLYFCTQTNSVTGTALTLFTNVSATINWSNDWHEVVLTYCATNSSIYIDGVALATNGSGVACWPGGSVRSQGFRIGSGSAGDNCAGGRFDNLQTYNYPWSRGDIASYHTNHFRPSGLTNTCQLAPIAINFQLAQTLTNGQYFTITNGSTTGNFGWLLWNGGLNQIKVANELFDFTLVTNFVDALNGPNVLQVGSWIQGSPGGQVGQVSTPLDNLIASGRQFGVVQWDGFYTNYSSGQGKNFAFQAAGYIDVILANRDNNNNWLGFIYKGVRSCDSFADQPPLAQIVSPTNSQVFNTPDTNTSATVPVVGAAFDPENTLTNVSFWNFGTNYLGTIPVWTGTTNIGTNIYNLYPLTWTNAPHGTNNLTVVAIDDHGLSTTSSIVSVVVNWPPIISAGISTNIIWPDSGAAVTLGGAAYDPDHLPQALTTTWSVVSSNGSVAVANSSLTNTTVTFSTNGVYVFQFVGSDGSAAVSSNCTVTIKQRPFVSITAPATGANYYLGQTVEIDVGAFDWDGNVTNVQIFTNGVLLGTAGRIGVSTNFSFFWAPPATGTYSITVTATDNDSLARTAGSVSITVSTPPGPTAQITFPTNGQVFVTSPQTIILAATANAPAGVTSLDFYNGVNDLGTGVLSNGVYYLTWTNVPAGNYSLTAKAWDNASNFGISPAVTFTVNAMPFIRIINPTNVQGFLETTNVTIKTKVSDADGAVVNVAFYSRTNLPFAVTSNANNWTLTWSNRIAGYYQVVAVATDDRGAQSASQICVFKVNPTNIAPNIWITYPTNGSMFADGSDLTIKADTAAGSAPVTNVEFFVNGQSIGSDSSAPYEIRQCCWKPGTYLLAAIASDSLGAKSISTNVEITIAKELPATSGFWDSQFGEAASEYFQFIQDMDGFLYPMTLAKADNDTKQIVYMAAGSGVFKVTDGTNWSESLFPSDDYDNIPYNAVLVDGTNIFGFGPTNFQSLENFTKYRLLKSDGASLSSYGNELDPETSWSGDDVEVRKLMKIGGDLYACGGFAAVPSCDSCDTNVGFIARFDAANNRWVSVGNGLNGPVFTMTSIGKDLYIGGAFTAAGGNPNIQYIARLSGNIWTNLGTGVSVRPPSLYETATNTAGVAYTVTRNNDGFMPVKALAACGTNLFVGGQFTRAGSNTNAHGIAIWDGVNWKTMNGGPGNVTDFYWYLNNNGTYDFYQGPDYYYPPIEVNTISVRGSRVYVGGNFSYVVNDDIQSKVTVDELVPNEWPWGREEIVSNSAVAIPARGIATAIWNESDQTWHWDGMDGGTFGFNNDRTVMCSLIVPGPDVNSYDLYVGGGFMGVGSEIISPQIARWRVGYPMPPGLPFVAITNPASGAILTATSALTITASASSMYTNISRVEFFANNVSIGETFFTNSDGAYTQTWSPPFGLSLLTAAAIDGAGLQNSSSPVLINVTDPSSTVTASNDTYTLFVNGGPATLNVLTNDHSTVTNRLRVLNAFIVQGNAGSVQVSYDGTAVIYTPRYNAYGTDIFAYSVTDGHSTNAAYVTVKVRTLPGVEIDHPSAGDQIWTNTGSSWSFNISGSAFEYGGTITNVDFYVNGTRTASTTNSSFSFPWSTSTAGVYAFKVVAFDADGYTNKSSVTVITFSATNDVTAAITNNELEQKDDGLGGYITPIIQDGLFDLKGQARVNGLTNGVLYQVLVHPVNDDETVIANVTPNADAAGYHAYGDSNGDLGVLDLSGLDNGAYDLELVVYGGGTNASVIVRFALESQLKIGQFGFSEQDLTIPVNGIPLTVTRTYNSLNTSSSDFGYGWSFALNDMDVQLDETRDTVTLNSDKAPFADDDEVELVNGMPQTVSIRSGGGWDVTLTLPDGRRVTFPFQPRYAPSEMKYYAEWGSPPGVNATLTIDPDPQSTLALDLFPWIHWEDSDMTLGYAPIENHDIRNFTLTTQDGTKYCITRGNGKDVTYANPNEPGQYVSAKVYGPPKLTKIQQRNGDAIIINTNNIYHQANGNITQTVSFTRDYAGRITAINDPGNPNGPPAVKYVYNNSTGNLIQVLKLVDRSANSYITNKYRYDNANFPHYITSIENADGVPVAKNYYDDNGKLIAVQDANGKLTQFIHNLTNDIDIVVDRLGYTNTYVYDKRGNVIAETNAVGQVNTMAYDNNGNKTNQIIYLNDQPYATNKTVYNDFNLPLVTTDALGHTNSYTYDGYGNVLTSTDARGNTSINTYDPNTGDLVSTSDALGKTTLNVYANGVLMGLSDAIGTITTNYYDASDNLIGTATIDSSGAILSSNTFTYDGNNNRLTSTVWRRVNNSWTGATTINIYDALNRVIQTIDPDGGTNTVIYNSTGKQALTIDKLGRATSYIYDPQGHLIKTTYPDSTSEFSIYDANGNRIQAIDRTNRVTSYVYDALNRLTQTIYPDNTTNTIVYDGVGRVAQTIDARGIITAFAYDVAGRRLAVTNAFASSAQTISTYGYDANGNQITFTDANNHTTTNIFDSLNRQIETDFADGTKTLVGYDAEGRRVAQTNQDNIVTQFGYDGAGRLISVIDALNHVTRYCYDEAGNEIAQIDALNRTNTFAYDGLGHRTAHWMPDTSLVERFAYDFVGNLVYQTNFNGAVITNLYDVANRLTAKIYPNGTSNTWTYTPTGQRATMKDSSGNYAYAYNARDQLTNYITPAGTLKYGYDANGNLTNATSSTASGTLVAYQYDSLNRLTNVIDGRLIGTQNTVYGFDAVGNLQRIQYPNGVTNLYQYDSLNRLTNLTWKTGSSPLASFAYTLGATGNRTGCSETVSGVTRAYTWQYDSLYRMTNEIVGGTAPIGILGYQFDPVGNRLNRTGSLGTLGSQTFTYTTNDWLTSDTYDNNGNTIASTGNSYQYDYESRLTNYNNGQVVFVYDADGNRVKKITASSTTLYLVDTRNPSSYAQVLEELTVSGGTTNLARAYTYGLDLISQRLPGSSTNFYCYDGHGSTRFLTSLSGSVTDTYAYDAYGLLITSTGTTSNNYLYCRQQYDSDLGFYYLRARYYKPDTGRFWTMDSVSGDSEDPLSLHKYLYGQCNPIDNYDPSGNASFSRADSAAIGRQVHDVIARDFQTKTGNTIGWSIFRYFNKPIGPNPFGQKIGQKFGRIFPDLVDFKKAEVYEIKPISLSGTAIGVAQLVAYIKLFNWLDPRGAIWHPGNSYFYENVEISLGSPPCFVIVAPPVSGMIYYEAFTVSQLGKAGARVTAKSDQARLQQSVGVSTLLAIMGAI